MSATQTLKSKQKAVKVKLSDLQTDVFVREKIDADYVLMLASLYEAGTEVAPIIVTRSMRVVDGRSRIEAAQLCQLQEIDAVVVDDMPRKQMLADAMNANLGGSRAPTKKDILMTMESLLKSGASAAFIRDNIKLPSKVVDSYLWDVRARIQTQKLAEASKLIAQGQTIEEAATITGVTVESIRTRILDQRKEKIEHSSAHIQMRITGRNRKAGQMNKSLFETVMKAFSDGDLTKEQVFEIADAIEHHGKLSVRSAEDFRKRFLQRIA